MTTAVQTGGEMRSRSSFYSADVKYFSNVDRDELEMWALYTKVATEKEAKENQRAPPKEATKEIK